MLPDTALARVIIRDVLNKEREKIPTTIVTELLPHNNVAILTGQAPRLHQLIREAFNVSDNATMRLALFNRYVLDTLMKGLPANIHLKGSFMNGIDPMMMIHPPSLIRNIYVLYHSKSEKCVVAYSLFGQESDVALLEKKNGVWKVSKTLVEYYQ